MTGGADAAADVSAIIERDGITFGRSDAALLRAIGANGSVSGATRELGRSRARALTRLQELEEAFGELVTRQRGGSDGGGSSLTDTAHRLLGWFDRLRANLAGTAGVAETVLSGRLVDSTGELGTIETDAGRLRARLVSHEDSVGDSRSGDSTRDVQVSVRASAVTLHDPNDAPSGGATSARNRFDGRVERIRSGDEIAHVRVDIGVADSLVALVTCDSVERLGLEPDTEVVASFKATATRAIPIDDRVHVTSDT